MSMKGKQAGMTLVEMLVAIAVAGIVILSLSQVVTTYLHLSQRGRYINLANYFVESEMEQFRNQGYNSLSLGTTNLSSQLPSQMPLHSSATMTVTSPSTGLKQVDISVSYPDQGQTNTYSYTSYLGELGVGQ